MKSCPIGQNAFYVDTVTAALLIRRWDEMDNTTPYEIAEMTLDEFIAAAKEGALPDDYSDPSIAREVFEDIVDFNQHSSFDGFVSTLYKERTSDPIEEYMADGAIVFLPLKKESTPTQAAYQNEEAIIKELKGTLGEYLPENFDWWRHLCKVEGTYFC